MSTIIRSQIKRAAPALILLLGLHSACADVVHERVQSEAVTFRVVEVLGGLDHPWSLAFLPGGGMLVTERQGRLQRVEQDGTATEISGLPEVAAEGQGGLLDVIVHPDFDSNRLIYFSYSAEYDGGLRTHVARAALEDDQLDEVEVLLRIDPPGTGGRHFGSRLAFDEERHLFITIGDRGDRDRVQELDTHHGKLLRINDDGSVPEDNPFVNEPGAHPEIYSYGHRNAQGLHYDATTETLWLHEHGPYGGDALHIIEAGANYGWPLATYGVEYGGRGEIGTTPDRREDINDPIVHWTQPGSIAPSGLTLYRGETFPEWNGNLFVGALAHQHIRRVVLDAAGTAVVHEEELLRDRIGRIRDVRTGPDGNLWFTTDSDPGGVYRIEPVDPAQRRPGIAEFFR
jgi:aldose sugar dehydrogenase